MDPAPLLSITDESFIVSGISSCVSNGFLNCLCVIIVVVVLVMVFLNCLCVIIV